MNRYLSLEREDLVIDLALLARLPAGLAEYYLALPMACEDSVVSVAMAHPENETALAVLSAVLGSPIVAVRAPSEALQAAVRRWYQQVTPSQPQILCWSANSIEVGGIAETANAFAAALSCTAQILSASELTLQTVLEIAGKGHYCLTILSLPAGAPLTPLLHHATAPLLLLRSNVLPVCRILVALRGYAADTQVLDWLAPLLLEPAAVTLMPLPQTTMEEARLLTLFNGSGKYHLDRCLGHPALAASHTLVRYRQGLAVWQVVDELRQEPYDLLALSAEGYGQFVGDVLSAVEAEPAAANTSLFLLRPPVPWRGECSIG